MVRWLLPLTEAGSRRCASGFQRHLLGGGAALARCHGGCGQRQRGTPACFLAEWIDAADAVVVDRRRRPQSTGHGTSHAARHWRRRRWWSKRRYVAAVCTAPSNLAPGTGRRSSLFSHTDHNGRMQPTARWMGGWMGPPLLSSP